MKETLLSIIAFFALLTSTHAQTALTGVVMDENDGLNLKNATVMILQSSDSLLLGYARTDINGKFTLHKPNSNNFLLVISYPKYADYYHHYEEGKNNLGEIKLTSIAHLIEEVVIKRRAPIIIKGDTTEYDASQFVVEKNAKVEDLLKVLPGITVDASGKITSQGKTVKKVLVDGEEFFGDDPTLVTQNLRSDMVDKVQVYEKKSDQAERTGVDDGIREQTINLQLKEDAKNGMFGKALAGLGTDDYYMGQLMLNKFKGSQKISVYSLLGNNATTSMNWEDSQKFGVEVDASFQGGTMIVSDPFSGQGVVGIPKAVNTGVNYNDRWNGDKHHLNLNYKYGKLASLGTETTTQSGNINSEKVNTVDTDNDQHRVNLRYTAKIDTLNELLFKGSITKKSLWNETSSSSANFSSNLTDTLVSNTSHQIENNTINNFDFNILYTKKFLKKGRALTLDVSSSKDETVGKDGYLLSTLVNSQKETFTTNQKKSINQDINFLQGKINYSEPLSTSVNMTIGYGVAHVSNVSFLESFNYNTTTDKYDLLDEKFSSNYDFNRLSNNYDLTLGYITQKLQATLTNAVNDDRLKQINNYNNRSIQRNYLTYNPNLSATYNFSTAKALRVKYFGKNQLPSLTQIQPILNNSDPLNVYEGNEDLTPSFNHNLDIFYHSFNLLSNQLKYIGANLNIINDPISQNITITDTINYYRWNNISGKKDLNFSTYAGYIFKLYKPLGIENSINFAYSIGAFNNFINGSENLVKSHNSTFSYEIKRETKTGFNFATKFSPQYRVMKSNLSPDLDNTGFVYASNGRFEYYFSNLFKVYVNYDYSYEAPTKAFDKKLERFLIHPGVSKKFFKNESLMLDFTINDLLNQNLNYSRTQSNSIFSQKRFDTIRRYYMLKLSWDFNKMFVK